MKVHYAYNRNNRNEVIFCFDETPARFYTKIKNDFQTWDVFSCSVEDWNKLIAPSHDREGITATKIHCA